jgi:hypothetical protein
VTCKEDGGGGVRAAVKRSAVAHDGVATWKKRRRGGLTRAEATKQGRAVTASDSADRERMREASDTPGRERMREPSDSVAAASDWAGRERGAMGRGFGHGSGGWSALYGAGARGRVGPMQRGVACQVEEALLMSGPGAERERVTGGTPRQILFRIKNTPERK